MDASNTSVIFTDEFKKKTKTKVSQRRKAELRLKKLVESNENGKLMAAKNRYQVAEIVGYPPQSANGYGWVLGAIKRGYIHERVVGIINDKMEYEYTLGKTELRKSGKKPQPKKTPEPVILDHADVEPKVLAIAQSKAIIRTHSFMVELTGYSATDIATIINNLTKGE